MKNTITTTLPLDIEIIQKLLQDDTICLEVDYDNSRIKSKPALIYLTNLNIKSVQFKSSNKQSIFSLIDTYITQKSSTNITCLVASVAMILLTIKEAKLNSCDKLIIEKTSLIRESDVEEYLEDKDRTINIVKLIHLLDNIPTFLYSCSKQFTEKNIDIEKEFTVINSIDYTGYSFINLLKNELFLIGYFSTPIITTPTYFKQQFEEYIYAGSNLFSSISETFILPTLAMIDTGEFSLESLKEIATNIEKE